jgi:hypothetical protein
LFSLKSEVNYQTLDAIASSAVFLNSSEVGLLLPQLKLG